MKRTKQVLRTFAPGLFFMGALWACGNRNTPPENVPTPMPAPEEQPLNQASPIEGSSQPIDTVRTLPDR